MIKSIEIKNFKSIKSKYFPLRNLNVLMGLNGQGKSSFIQSLLLLRQSSESLSEGFLKLNGALVNIGTTADALYQYSDKKDGLSFEVKFTKKDPFHLDFEYVPGSDTFQIKDQKIPLKSGIRNEVLFSNNFQYLSAHRIKPTSIHQRSYSSVVTNGDIGSTGEYTVDYLATRGDDIVKLNNLIHKNTQSSKDSHGNMVSDKRLKNQVNLWMQEVSPNLAVKTTSIASDLVKLEYEFIQQSLGKTNAFKPENVGYGISNVLPVVVSILKAQPGDLLIIENPESQTHPKAQATLGRMISLLAMNDVQIIIETHSDHVINGIRVGIKENETLHRRAILFYFEKIFSEIEQYSYIKNIEFDPQGELSEYPDTLLSEWSNQLLKLF